MQSHPFNINSTYETLVDSYLQLTVEEKYAYCDVVALGNLMMGVGEKAVNYNTRLNVFYFLFCSWFISVENLKITSIVFLVVSFLAGI